MTETAVATRPDQTPAERKPTYSERFLANVEHQLEGQMGAGFRMTAYQQKLVQHMYLKVDANLKTAEEDRQRRNLSKAEFTWHNLDLQQLALDTVHAVSLGLDPLMKNHVHPVMFWNSTKNKYVATLIVGYAGRLFLAKKHAIEPPVAITFELVYDSDEFAALPRSSEREVEGYRFEITSPFKRGKIVGGFGYIQYDDARKNRLVLVTERDFNRAKGSSPSKFWQENEVEMHLKTVIHRTCARVDLDPEKVNAQALASLKTDDPLAAGGEDVEEEVAANANRTRMDFDDDRTVDVEAQPARRAPQQAPGEASDAPAPSAGPSEPPLEPPDQPNLGIPAEPDF